MLRIGGNWFLKLLGKGERGKGKGKREKESGQGDGESGRWGLGNWKETGALQFYISNCLPSTTLHLPFSEVKPWVWRRETVKVNFFINSWNHYVFDVFYESTRFYASLTESTRFCWFSSFNPDSTRFLCFNS